MRVLIKQGAQLLSDSGTVFDSTFSGGRLGVFVYDQPNVIWSKMKVKCVERYWKYPPIQNLEL